MLQSRTQRQAAQEPPLQTQKQDQGDIVKGNESAERHPAKAPKAKRLPPLPPTVRPPQHSQQAGKAQQHGMSSGSGKVRGGHQSLHHQQPQLRQQQQQQNNGEGSSKSASKSGATTAQPQGDHQPVQGKAGSAKADEHPSTAAQTEPAVSRVTLGSAVPIHAAAEGHAEETGHAQPVQSKTSTGRVKTGPPDHQAATGSSQQRQIDRKGRGKADTSVTPGAQPAVAMQPGRAKPNPTKVTRTAVASNHSTEASDEAAEAAPSDTSKPAAALKSVSGGGTEQHEVKGQAPDVVAADSEARSADVDCGSHNKGQQQVACLTASNTALLSELVELQVPNQPLVSIGAPFNGDLIVSVHINASFADSAVDVNS